MGVEHFIITPDCPDYTSFQASAAGLKSAEDVLALQQAAAIMRKHCCRKSCAT